MTKMFNFSPKDSCVILLQMNQEVLKNLSRLKPLFFQGSSSTTGQGLHVFCNPQTIFLQTSEFSLSLQHTTEIC